MMSFRFVWFFAVFTAVSCPAGAQERDRDREQRAVDYQRGRRAMTERDWQTAYEIFSELWIQAPSYDVAMNLGQSELNLNRYRAAAEHLDYAIRHIAPREMVPVLKRGRQLLEVAKRHVVTVHVSGAPTGAAVQVDETSIGKTPLGNEIYVDPGPHVVRVTHADYEPREVPFTGQPGQELTIEAPLTARVPSKAGIATVPMAAHAPAGSPAIPAVTGARPETSSPSERRGMQPTTLALIVGGGLTGVALGSAVLFRLKASSATDEAERAGADIRDQFGEGACSRPQSAARQPCSEVASSLDERNRANAFANWSLAAAGVAALATGATFFFLSRQESSADSGVRISFAGHRRAGGILVDGAF